MMWTFRRQRSSPAARRLPDRWFASANRSEAHPQGRGMRTKILHRRGECGAWTLAAEFRVGYRTAVAIRIAEMHAGFRRMVQLVRRQIIPQHVAAVVGEPEFLGDGMPIEADGVADAARKYFRLRAVDFHAQDIGVTVRVRFADIAWRADRHIQPAVRADCNKLPAVLRLLGQIAAYKDRLDFYMDELTGGFFLWAPWHLSKALLYVFQGLTFSKDAA